MLWLMASCELSFYRADLFFQYLFYVSCVEQVVTSWRRCGLMTYLHDTSMTSRSVFYESPMRHALIEGCPNLPHLGVRLGVPRLLLHRLWLVMRCAQLGHFVAMSKTCHREWLVLVSNRYPMRRNEIILA